MNIDLIKEKKEKARKSTRTGLEEEGRRTKSSSRASTPSLASTVTVEGSGAETNTGRQVTVGNLQPTVKLTKLSPANSLASISVENREQGGSRRKEEVRRERGSAAGAYSGHLDPLGLTADEEEEGNTEIPDIPEGKNRRPPSTGDYYVLLEARKRRKKEEEEKRVRDILDPTVTPDLTQSYQEFLEDIRAKEAQYRHHPIPDLEAMAAEQATTIFKVADRSKKMQGPLIKEAKKAAAKICAVATALAIKAQNPSETLVSEQLEDLRAQMDKLRHENQNLKILLKKWEWKQKNASKGRDEEARGAEAPLPQRPRRKTDQARREKEEHREASLLSKDREASLHREEPGISLPHLSGETPGLMEKGHGDGSGGIIHSIHGRPPPGKCYLPENGEAGKERRGQPRETGCDAGGGSRALAEQETWGPTNKPRPVEGREEDRPTPTKRQQGRPPTGRKEKDGEEGEGWNQEQGRHHS
ncbi:gag-like protein [Lasius niger]|uniref:Gag-like protein n=1 Tax=Lasius niger TaxID=67767 RepID=A0A0J7K5F9_LASNI|nr:gag-like protein [Lasius niger]